MAFLVGGHNMTKETLKQCINFRLKMEQTCKSDCWKVYESLGKHGYNHLSVDNSPNFTLTSK